MKTAKLLSTLFLLFSLLPISARADESVGGRTPGEWRSGKSGSMEYWMYIPATFDEGPSKLMMSLHGCAQKAEELKAAGNWETAADQYRMIVVLPKVPNGGVIAGCWDYYGSNHTETNRHNGPLIQLTESLLNDRTLNIDKKSVYISGLSSGAGETFVLACLRPDLFSGVGLNATPLLGTQSSELQRPGVTAQQSVDLCRQLAGSRVDDLKTQVTSIILGDQDFIVNAVHSSLASEVLQEIYSAREKIAFDPKDLTGSNTRGRGEIYRDERGKNRISFFVNSGLGHAWPAGNGKSASGQALPGGFISSNSVNYPMYLGKFLSENSLR